MQAPSAGGIEALASRDSVQFIGRMAEGPPGIRRLRTGIVKGFADGDLCAPAGPRRRLGRLRVGHEERALHRLRLVGVLDAGTRGEQHRACQYESRCLQHHCRKDLSACPWTWKGRTSVMSFLPCPGTLSSFAPNPVVSSRAIPPVISQEASPAGRTGIGHRRTGRGLHPRTPGAPTRPAQEAARPTPEPISSLSPPPALSSQKVGQSVWWIAKQTEK